jgi:tetratricopeptide (TPR) repeat protein
MRAKDYATAELIQKRILEIKPGDAEATAKVGVIKMFKNEYAEAHDLLQKAFKKNSREPHAVYGLAGLYKNFYFSSQLKRVRTGLGRVKKPREFAHPSMNQL